MSVYYTGQKRQEIISHIRLNGNLHGYLYNVHDHAVTKVSFEVINGGDLVFKMHGQEFDNPTNALIALHDELAMETRGATGSKNGTAGNAASDIIGQYRIYPHIRFGGKTGKTLADIVGSEPREWSGVTSSRSYKPRTTKVTVAKKKSGYGADNGFIQGVDNRWARQAFYVTVGGKYSWDTMKQLIAKFGKETVSRDFQALTNNEMELRYGLV